MIYLPKDLEKGYILILVLFLLLMVGVTNAAMLSVALFENKMSFNVTDLQKAEQAADAGITWAMEATYNFLEEGANQNLPEKVLLNDENMAVISGETMPYFQIDNTGATLDKGEVDGSHCIYNMTCTGYCNRACHRIRVQTAYSFASFYNTDESGQSVFAYRVYKNHGVIISYTIGP